MPLIRKISVNEKSLQIAPQRKVFADFFDIDSCHVVLGKNNAGKTGLLVSIAELFTQSTVEPYILVESGDVGLRTMDTQERLRQGVLYYTALPYQRRFHTSGRVIDISSSGKEGNHAVRFDMLKRISEDLGLKVTVRASITYSKAVFTEILIPAIVTTARLSDRHNTSEHFGDLPRILAKQNDILKHGVDEDVLYEQESRLQKVTDRLTARLENLIFERRPGRRGVIELAALEQMAARSSNKRHIANQYLASIGLTGGGTTMSFLHELGHSVKLALSYIERRQAVAEGSRSISFLISSEKEAQHISQSGSVIRIVWSDLSSGMRALIDQFYRIRVGIQSLHAKNCKNVLLMIDEGDAYLHLDWQRRYVEFLNKFLGGLKREFRLETLQTILTTHSPVIVTDFPSSMVTNLDAGVTPRETFASPLDEITQKSFGTSAIGTFAAEKLNNLHRRLANGTETLADRALLDEIGDLLIKGALRRVSDNNSKK